MVEGPGGAGRGLPICGGASVAAMQASARPIVRARRSVGTSLPLCEDWYPISDGTFTATSYRRTTDPLDGGLRPSFQFDPSRPPASMIGEFVFPAAADHQARLQMSAE